MVREGKEECWIRMRRIQKLMTDWMFTGPLGRQRPVDLPHTWNDTDGQDGGNDYWRGTCVYEKEFEKPQFDEHERVYLQFHGVNASAKVIVNGQEMCSHDNGYSTFRVDVTEVLSGQNTLRVEVDNSVNDRVYPQKADFTFYGGIYRDVEFLFVSKEHFDLDYYGGPGMKIETDVEGNQGILNVTAYTNVEDLAAAGLHIAFTVLDAEGNAAAEKVSGQSVPSGRENPAEFGAVSGCGKARIVIADAHLWDGIRDPYLYTVQAFLCRGEEVVDTIESKCGIRTFSVDPDKGFFLNGKSYPLRGVSRHQDWKESAMRFLTSRWKRIWR